MTKRDYEVRPVDLATAYELVKAFHYARSGSNTATFIHGLFAKSEWMRCLGVAWWLPPTKGAAIASWDGDWKQVLSLSRLVIAPEVPQNGASFLLGQSEKLIRADGRFKCLVTYADQWQGHTGQIYKATNWEEMGLTKPERIYVISGRIISRKAGPRTRTHSEMLSLGANCIGQSKKVKFRKIFA